MSIEVELKLKIRDKAEITASLKQLGFTEEELVVETDTYYTAAHHDFAALDEALRIRTVENLHTKEQSAVITYKGAKLDQTSMTRKELETEIGDAETGREILEYIGFVPVPPVEKQRQYWKNVLFIHVDVQTAGKGVIRHGKQSQRAKIHRSKGRARPQLKKRKCKCPAASDCRDCRSIRLRKDNDGS